ncbi:MULTISPECIES: hypothetical protein [Bradyrhizobium]|uniref:Uncharacterized protein n=1 Tax=Bradyrhizobium elkanii TaxID=29448 RepID=A0A8I2CA75_BRAEL|nr:MULTISPECIES: hypothetical protein [Bradyrhizobium]MBP1299332.1 hypothetical protein [Bradyrhizobium elkanii]MCP1929810.1 hypothetical protein [Bradyrhizobium elkanii]MCS3579575.1 hypothetical protein [Bradyrhizobium elkanii]MCS3722446.1 hypothetical protein [Bradyrhizobium elkanii]MCS4006862.1 hypothetical protein [Bradyrhizobium elkanii USDA 61]
MLRFPLILQLRILGYVWAASWNQSGVGTLQVLTVDASAFDGGSIRGSQIVDGSGSNTRPAEKTEEQKAEESRLVAEKAAADKAAADKKAADLVAAEKAAAEKAAAEQAAAAQAAADKAAQQAEAELARRNEIRRRGSDYAILSETIWNITRTPNEMTDKVDIIVKSIQKNNQGLVVEVEGTCKNGEVRFSGLVVGDDGKPNVNLVGRTAIGDGSIGFGVPALYRVNDRQPSNVIIPELEFINKLQLVVFANPSRKSETFEDSVRLMGALLGANVFARTSETWRIMTELKTDRGNVIVKIPIFDANIQALFQSCS